MHSFSLLSLLASWMPYLQRQDSVLNLCEHNYQFCFLHQVKMNHWTPDVTLTHPPGHRQTGFIPKWCTPPHKIRPDGFILLSKRTEHYGETSAADKSWVFGALNILTFIPLHHLEAPESICGLFHLTLPCKLMSSWVIGMQVVALLVKSMHPYCSRKDREFTIRSFLVPANLS